jgi:hypothetical protein
MDKPQTDQTIPAVKEEHPHPDPEELEAGQRGGGNSNCEQQAAPSESPILAAALFLSPPAGVRLNVLVA